MYFISKLLVVIPFSKLTFVNIIYSFLFALRNFQVKKFSWIPLPLPPQCRMVLTTSPSDYSFTCLSKRPDVQVMCLQSVSTTKLKTEILEEHMQTHFDNLTRSHLQTLFDSKLSGRPQFLSVVGTDMCSFTVYTNLDNYIETVREMCTSMRDVYTRCFRRWSQDYSWTYDILSADQTDQDTIGLFIFHFECQVSLTDHL